MHKMHLRIWAWTSCTDVQELLFCLLPEAPCAFHAIIRVQPLEGASAAIVFRSVYGRIACLAGIYQLYSSCCLALSVPKTHLRKHVSDLW